MILIFDTETSGLPHKTGGLDKQPHLMQLAVSLYDKERRPVFELSTLVALPEGVTCDEKAINTHGITPELSRKYGVSAKQAVALLKFAAARAEVIVAHNLQFDDKLVGFAATRAGNDVSPIFGIPTFCTMEACAPILKIPPTEAMIKWGHGDKFKSPSLSETYKFFFGENLEGAHDALIDTRACARVYFHLLDNKLV